MSGYGHDEAMRDVWLKEPHEFVSEVILAKRERLAAYIERLEAERDAAERDAATLQSIVGNTVKAELLRELFRAYSAGELVERFDLEANCDTCPANTTDQIAATTATRGDIASHEGDATIPAVVQDAQRYDRRSDPRANGALAALTDALRKE